MTEKIWIKCIDCGVLIVKDERLDNWELCQKCFDEIADAKENDSQEDEYPITGGWDTLEEKEGR